MRTPIATAIILAGTALVSAPPVLPPQQSTASYFNVRQIEDKTVESYFELYVSEDLTKWDYIGSYSQDGTTNAPNAVLRIIDQLPLVPNRAFKRVGVSKDQFDNPPTPSGKYGTGILVFLK